MMIWTSFGISDDVGMAIEEKNDFQRISSASLYQTSN
jgi:hypothetical protein